MCSRPTAPRRRSHGRPWVGFASVADVAAAVSYLSGDEAGCFGGAELLMEGGHYGDTDPLAAGAGGWRQPRIPLPCVPAASPSPTSAASEADVTVAASGAGTSTMAWLLIGLGPASTGEICVGGFDHPLARRADAYETDVPQRDRERSIVCPDERTSHGA